ncbi:hypothetical protein [Angustibacter luteus]|uniref:Uncharacterized protein n=1 Tax=Angustibacter luteus TaxID=658456 RepID=A0ABW1JHV2_9ACTN
MGEPSVVALSVSSAPFWFWWLVPVAATVVVLVVVGVARRERRPKDGTDTIEDYTRFREAMAQVRRQEKDSE